MFAANDSETEIYYASESLPDLDSELEENVQDEDLEAANDAEDDLSLGNNYNDFNITNMELDGDYTSEDEEQRPRVSTAYGFFQRLGAHATRHHRRSSSQRIRGFSPLSSRVTLRRSNAITASLLTQHIKHNSELGSKTINGVGSKELGQFHLPESSFLRAGMSFAGTQNLMNTQPSQSNEEWEVKVVNTVHYVNYKTGTAIGLMEALNVPSSSNTVVTYWEGEMIDFVNHSLWTDKWNSTPDIDLQHWKKFDAFRQMDVRRGTPSREWFQEACQKYIFMRWKEHYFVNVTAQESGLTIAGFYYICIRRSDGAIEGYYFDPVSTPYQKLTLKPLLEGNGVSFCDYT
ncbi:927_t:CDS:2 [Diversispora eburnea]|uniref:927_t:CDS:1 n=1 Tax=Diversispora eburnea TaxID=1213867 RepID=A0A9N8WD65_9GLOM|nr:927_t:CDS:2 [Diversispora eburnea]